MKILRIVLLLLTVSSMLKGCEDCAFSLQGYSFLSPRSQSVNAGRELVGWRDFINLGCQNGWYTAFYAAPQYGTSFRNYRIAEYFFGNNEISVAGSNYQNRDNFILADYFGLSPDFLSEVGLNPKINTGLIDFNWYLGYKKWYFRIHAPVVWTKTEFELNEIVQESGAGTPFPALYMADGAISAPARSFTQAMATQVTYGEVREGLQFGRIVPCQKITRLSDVQMALGYNFIADEIMHVGFNFRCYAPAGNRSEARYLLEPIVGNGHHWELGMGFTTHFLVWQKDTDQHVGIYFDGNFTGILPSTQRRSFDFGVSSCQNQSNFGSRYILLKEFDTAGDYTRNAFPAINYTTLYCRVHNNFQMDIALMLGYSSRWVDFDIGYEVWLRSKEHVCLLEGLDAKRFGLKGIQNVALAPAVISNATQTETATLEGNYYPDRLLVVDTPSPQFVSTEDLNLSSGAAPMAFTQKVFWNLSHAWNHLESTSVAPFVGIGGEFEFEGLNPRRTTEPNQNSVSQWALWIKGGFAY